MDIPFPGMDPYLEHPVLWPGLHTRLMVAMANQLKPVIRPRYIASVEERVYLDGGDEDRIPDVAVHKIREDTDRASAGVAVMDTPLLVKVDELEVHEPYLQILDRREGMRVVTVIEVVSPSNKAAGRGRKSYKAKQQESLARESHLVEIDLLRRGRHVLAVEQANVRALGAYQYLACVNRWPARKVFEVYLRSLRDRLPCIRLPLAQPDADVPLDVQAALDQVYDDGDYLLRIRYDQACEPPLESTDQQWASECWAAYKAAHAALFPPSAT